MVPDTKRMGDVMDLTIQGTFLDETSPVRGFVSLAPVSIVWKDKVGRYEVKLTKGLVVSLQKQHSWTIPSAAWTPKDPLGILVRNH